MPNLIEQVEALLPEGWTVEEDSQTGQPNGMGEVEPTWFRDWFDTKNATHDREEITLYGPWVKRDK